MEIMHFERTKVFKDIDLEAVGEAYEKHRLLAGRGAFIAICERAVEQWKEAEANLHGLDLDRPREECIDINALKERMESIYSKAVKRARDSVKKEEEEI